VKARNIHIFDGESGIRVQSALYTGGEFAGIGWGRIERRIGAINRTRNAVERRCQRTTARELERANGGRACQVLLERVDSVLLDGIVLKGERVAVVKHSRAGTEHPWTAAAGMPRNAQPGREVAGRRAERAGKSLGFVADSADHGKTGRRAPLILDPEGDRIR
jgi:hypothetical protein